MKNLDLTLYLVTNRGKLPWETFCSIIEQAIEGGVTVIQLREKEISQKEFIKIGRSLKERLQLKGKQIPLIINDAIEVALEIGAEGVHLGQSDASVEKARQMLGKKAIIGLSVETMEQARAAGLLDIDYIAASPIFATPSKLNTAAPWGLEGLKELCRISKYPVVGIGGINSNNVQNIISSGATGVAVISAIFYAESPFLAAQEFHSKIMKVKDLRTKKN